jgi:hypothetical protein
LSSRAFGPFCGTTSDHGLSGVHNERVAGEEQDERVGITLTMRISSEDEQRMLRLAKRFPKGVKPKRGTIGRLVFRAGLDALEADSSKLLAPPSDE